MDGAPWVALDFGADSYALAAMVPCTGYPTPGVIDGDGNVINPDVFGKVFEGSIDEWLYIAANPGSAPPAPQPPSAGPQESCASS